MTITREPIKAYFTPLALACGLLAGCSPEPATTPELATHPAPSSATATAAKTLHPSWDADGDGTNDCEKDGSCDHTQDYSQPRPSLQQTSFDCHQVTAGSIAQQVCLDPGLAELDRRLADTYGASLQQALPTLQAEQRNWLLTRDACKQDVDSRACIKLAYQQRTAELQASYRLVNGTGPIHFACEPGTDTLLITFYASDIPTLLAQRGDSSSLMYQVRAASGAKYQGHNASFWEHQGEAQVTWDDATFTCKAIGQG